MPESWQDLAAEFDDRGVETWSVPRPGPGADRGVIVHFLSSQEGISELHAVLVSQSADTKVRPLAEDEPSGPETRDEIPDELIVNAAMDLDMDPRDLIGADAAPLIDAVVEAREALSWNISKFRNPFDEPIEWNPSEREMEELLDHIEELQREAERAREEEGR